MKKKYRTDMNFNESGQNEIDNHKMISLSVSKLLSSLNRRQEKENIEIIRDRENFFGFFLIYDLIFLYKILFTIEIIHLII